MRIEEGPFANCEVHSPEECLDLIDNIGQFLIVWKKKDSDNPEIQDVCNTLIDALLDVRVGVTVHILDKLLEYDETTEHMINQVNIG